MRESVLILCRNERETILYAAEELKRYLSLAGVSAWTSVQETHSPYMKILELAVTPEEFWGSATRSHTNTIPQGAKLCGR